MNKFLVYEGNQPVWLNDLEYMQQATQEALKGIVTAVCDTEATVILSGVDVTVRSADSGTEYIVTAGWMAINGEILPVKASTLTVSTGATMYWRIVSEKKQNVTLGNGQEVQIYEERYVTLTDIMPDGEYIEYFRVKYIQNYLKNVIRSRTNVAKLHNVQVHAITIREHISFEGNARLEVLLDHDGTELTSNKIAEFSELEIAVRVRGIIVTYQEEKGCIPYIITLAGSVVSLYNLDGSPITALPKCEASAIFNI